MTNNCDCELKQWSELLLRLCKQHGVVDPGIGTLGRRDDILNSGLIDSMGLIYMQAMIEQEFGVELSTEMLITELRDIDRIAAYVARNTPPERIPVHLLSLQPVNKV
jgi:acyl carrier protein